MLPVAKSPGILLSSIQIAEPAKSLYCVLDSWDALLGRVVDSVDGLLLGGRVAGHLVGMFYWSGFPARNALLGWEG